MERGSPDPPRFVIIGGCGQPRSISSASASCGRPRSISFANTRGKFLSYCRQGSASPALANRLQVLRIQPVKHQL